MHSGWWFFIFLFFGISSLTGQQVFLGKIVDSETNEPVEFAHVFPVSDQSRGVFSNQLGQFRIRLNQSVSEDSLMISQLGYQTAKVPLEKSQDTILVQLRQNVYNLAAVTIMTEDALKDIFRRAIKKIPEHYGHNKYTIQGYYQEYFISDSAYAEIIEAFVNIQDRNYRSPDLKSTIRVESMRKSDDLRNLPAHLKGDDINQLYSTYEWLNNLRLRSFHFMSRSPSSLFKYFKFYNLGEYVENRDTLIKIGLKHTGVSTKLRQMPFAHGEVIIRKSDLGILKVRRGASSDGSYHEATYRKIKGKYYPHKIQHLLTFKYQNQSRTYLQARQLYIYNLLEKGQKKKGTIIGREKNLRAYTLPYDASFWEDNAILIPLPAPEILKSDMEKLTPLEDQFTSNAKKQ